MDQLYQTCKGDDTRDVIILKTSYYSSITLQNWNCFYDPPGTVNDTIASIPRILLEKNPSMQIVMDLFLYASFNWRVCAMIRIANAYQTEEQVHRELVHSIEKAFCTMNNTIVFDYHSLFDYLICFYDREVLELFFRYTRYTLHKTQIDTMITRVMLSRDNMMYWFDLLIIEPNPCMIHTLIKVSFNESKILIPKGLNPIDWFTTLYEKVRNTIYGVSNQLSYEILLRWARKCNMHSMIKRILYENLEELNPRIVSKYLLYEEKFDWDLFFEFVKVNESNIDDILQMGFVASDPNITCLLQYITVDRKEGQQVRPIFFRDLFSRIHCDLNMILSLDNSILRESSGIENTLLELWQDARMNITNFNVNDCSLRMKLLLCGFMSLFKLLPSSCSWWFEKDYHLLPKQLECDDVRLADILMKDQKEWCRSINIKDSRQWLEKGYFRTFIVLTHTLSQDLTNPILHEFVLANKNNVCEFIGWESCTFEMIQSLHESDINHRYKKYLKPIAKLWDLEKAILKHAYEYADMLMFTPKKNPRPLSRALNHLYSDLSNRILINLLLAGVDLEALQWTLRRLPYDNRKIPVEYLNQHHFLEIPPTTPLEYAIRFHRIYRDNETKIHIIQAILLYTIANEQEHEQEIRRYCFDYMEQNEIAHLTTYLC